MYGDLKIIAGTANPQLAMDICDHLGKEVPFEMAGGRDGFFDDTHVHFAIYSREEVQEMINELQESLKTAYL